MPPKWTYLILICLPEMLGVLVKVVNFSSNLFNLPVENLVFANLFTAYLSIKSIGSKNLNLSMIYIALYFIIDRLNRNNAEECKTKSCYSQNISNRLSYIYFYAIILALFKAYQLSSNDLLVIAIAFIAKLFYEHGAWCETAMSWLAKIIKNNHRLSCEKCKKKKYKN